MRWKAIPVMALILLMAGCTFVMNPPDVIPGEDDQVPFARLLSPCTIYAPLLNGMPFGYNAYVQPGETMNLDFRGGRDQYGNKTGLSDPVRFAIEEVIARCEQKQDDDTIFWPSAEFPIPYMDNTCVWFPGWTAPIEQISGLPYPFRPLSGYPWDACGSHSVQTMSSQLATIVVTAKASVLRIEFLYPIMDIAGTYRLQIAGSTPERGKIVEEDGKPFAVSIVHNLTDPGTYTVVWRSDDGEDEEAFEFDVPADWFYAVGQWSIAVGPTGVTCSVE